jgi:hypothetical protein
MTADHRGRVGAPTQTLPRYAAPVKLSGYHQPDNGVDCDALREDAEGPPPSPEALARLRARVAALPAASGRPPPDPGEVLLDLTRGAEGVSLRVALKTFDGGAMARPAHYVDVRLHRGAWPIKGKGLALRRGELLAVAEALAEAAELLAGGRR